MLNNTFYEIWIQYDCKGHWECEDDLPYSTFEDAKSDLDAMVDEDKRNDWVNNYKILKLVRTEEFEYTPERSE